MTKNSKRMIIRYVIVLMAMTAMRSYADMITKPYTFSAGELISASKMNSNFDVLYSTVNGGLDSVNLVTDRLSLNKVSGGAMTALAGGEIGIGTATPGQELDVIGDAYVRGAGGSNDNQIWFKGSDTNIGLELRSGGSSGTPYLDLTNDSATDYDMRIILTGDNELRVTGGELRGSEIPEGPLVHRVTRNTQRATRQIHRVTHYFNSTFHLNKIRNPNSTIPNR